MTPLAAPPRPRALTVPAPHPAALAAYARSLAVRPELWEPLVRFDPAGRQYARIPTGDGPEAWLLSWLPGHATGLHDHGGSAGAFVVLQGSLVETTLRPRSTSLRQAQRRLRTDGVRAFGAHHVHDVLAPDEPSVSLHVYAPHLRAMTRYALRDGRLTVLRTERAGSDW